MHNYSYILPKLSLFLIAALVTFSCKTPIEPDFTFSPEMPKAGERISFTNLTEEGKLWDWEFGDGGRSRLQNTTYTYRRPGIYDVTLMIDSNKHYVKTKQITIYDTVPSIHIEEKKVKYYQETTFKALIYNPYNYKPSYEWEFSSNAHGEDIEDGKSSKSTVTVYFSQTDVEETVNLKIYLNDSIYNISRSFIVEDVPARSLLMAQPNGKIIRQRMYDRGFEEYKETSISAGKNPFSIKTQANSLYIFDAGSHVGLSTGEVDGKQGDGNIRKINLASEESFELIHNRDVGAEHSFYNGFVDDANIYWTDLCEFIYKTPISSSTIGSLEWKGDADSQTSLPYYFVKTDRLGYFGNDMEKGQFNAGIYTYDNIYFWAKGGKGKGIYRFTNKDILTENVSGIGTPPQAGSILQDFAIRAFDIDYVNKKIYFSVTAPEESVGFWVANMTGTDAVKIDDSPMDQAVNYITGIIVDYATNRVYWSYIAPKTTVPAVSTHRSGIKTVRLARNNYVDKNIEYFTEDVEVLGISIDEMLR